MTRRAVVIFGLLFIASLLIAWFAPSSSVLSGFSVNLSTGILTIALTVWLIDQALQRQEEERQRRLIRTAFERLRIPLSDHAHFWAMLFKSALPRRPAQAPTSFRDLLAPVILDELKELNLESAAPVHPPVPWTHYLQHEIAVFSKSVDAVTDKFAFVLGPDEIRVLEEVANSAFVVRFPTMIATLLREPGRHGRALAGLVEGKLEVSPLVIEHLTAVANLIDQFNLLVAPEKQISLRPGWWGDNMAPSFGASRHAR